MKGFIMQKIGIKLFALILLATLSSGRSYSMNNQKKKINKKRQIVTQEKVKIEAKADPNILSTRRELVNTMIKEYKKPYEKYRTLCILNKKLTSKKINLSKLREDLDKRLTFLFQAVLDEIEGNFVDSNDFIANLIRQVRDVVNYRITKNDPTPLHLALIHGKTEIAKTLISHGANTYSKGKDKNVNLRSPAAIAEAKKLAEITKYINLTRKKAKAIYEAIKNGYTHRAKTMCYIKKQNSSKSSYSSKSGEAFEVDPALINFVAKDGSTLLHYASHCDDHDFCEFLLEERSMFFAKRRTEKGLLKVNPEEILKGVGLFVENDKGKSPFESAKTKFIRSNETLNLFNQTLEGLYRKLIASEEFGGGFESDGERDTKEEEDETSKSGLNQSFFGRFFGGGKKKK